MKSYESDCVERLEVGIFKTQANGREAASIDGTAAPELSRPLTEAAEISLNSVTMPIPFERAFSSHDSDRLGSRAPQQNTAQ
jgi:hypothetical protein